MDLYDRDVHDVLLITGSQRWERFTLRNTILPQEANPS